MIEYPVRRTWCSRNGGISTMSRATSSAGANRREVVPFAHGRLSVSTTLPSGCRSTRGPTSGGRSMYRASRPSPARSRAAMTTPAWRLYRSKALHQAGSWRCGPAGAGGLTRRPARGPTACRSWRDAAWNNASVSSSSSSGSWSTSTISAPRRQLFLRAGLGVRYRSGTTIVGVHTLSTWRRSRGDYADPVRA
jgi:hypothetical protein